ncbi:unnamed protein product [Prunus armeniaca]|uniref:AB hydrolase-1 domain-containing protein n=1 Tax=Prunus armeniaca TaxID=36596 RepID=A0A6J5UYA1_PRUAR|nr:unnamed protein product [Prunus armeniaca]
MPRRMSKFSGFESNGFILFSSLNGQIGEGSFPSPEATANNNAPEKVGILEVTVKSFISGSGFFFQEMYRKNFPLVSREPNGTLGIKFYVFKLAMLPFIPNLYMELEGLFYPLSACWQQWPGISINSWFWSKQVYIMHTLLLISRQLIAIGLVGLQAAVMEPQLCKGVMLLNISLRMLHIKKQPWYGRPLIRSFQHLLRNTDVGKYFFKIVATPESVRNILCQCYHDTSQVAPFLRNYCLNEGWGEKDPWEPIELGRAYGKFNSVEDYVVLPNVGHCPQDEAPDLVNPLVESFVARHAALSASISTAT